jgi:hypothetical protein
MATDSVAGCSSRLATSGQPLNARLCLSHFSALQFDSAASGERAWFYYYYKKQNLS